MFGGGLKAANATVQFLPFLLTILRGSGTPMSGKNTTFGKRLAIAIAILSTTTLVWYYNDYHLSKQEHKTLSATLAKIKEEGVLSKEQKDERTQMVKNQIRTEALLEQCKVDNLRLTDQNTTLIERNIANVNMLNVTKENLRLCIENRTKPTDVVPDDSFKDLLKELQHITS